MKKIFLLFGLAAMSIPYAFALITVPMDYPLGGINGAQATDKEQLALLVSRYQNDVVLLVNPPGAYSKEIVNTVAVPATMAKLKSLGTSAGALSVDSLANAVTALVRQNPSDSPSIVASAIEMLKDLPGGQSAENRLKIARAAIKGLPQDLEDEAKLIALITGVSVKGLGQTAVAAIVKSLRDFAIDDVPTKEQAAFALAVDQALVNEGILSPYAGSPEFLVLADNFADDQLAETFFSGDQGVINQGAIFAPGAAGSAGGAGNSGNQGAEPTPAPTPTPPPPAS